jgi:hypothetical protein
VVVVAAVARSWEGWGGRKAVRKEVLRRRRR